VIHTSLILGHSLQQKSTFLWKYHLPVYCGNWRAVSEKSFWRPDSIEDGRL